MSHEATNWAIKQRGLKPSAKVVLWHLCDRYHPDHGCFPSLDTLSDDCEMSRRSVQDQIDTLVEAGLISVEKMPREKGRLPKNRYRFAFENEDETLGQDLPKAKSALGKIDPPPLAKSDKNLGQNLPTNPVRGTSKVTSKGAAGDNAAASEQNPTDREVLLDAMGVGPDGIAGPSSFIGGMADMAEAEKWSRLGLSLTEQANVIRETCAKTRRSNPAWMPRSFKYFSPALAEYAARKLSPLPQPANATPPMSRRAKWNKMSGAA